MCFVNNTLDFYTAIKLTTGTGNNMDESSNCLLTEAWNKIVWFHLYKVEEQAK